MWTLIAHFLATEYLNQMVFMQSVTNPFVLVIASTYLDHSSCLQCLRDSGQSNNNVKRVALCKTAILP